MQIKRNWKEDCGFREIHLIVKGVTKVSLSELIFKLKVITKIPANFDTSVDEDFEINVRDKEYRETEKVYVDAYPIVIYDTHPFLTPNTFLKKKVHIIFNKIRYKHQHILHNIQA